MPHSVKLRSYRSPWLVSLVVWVAVFPLLAHSFYHPPIGKPSSTLAQGHATVRLPLLKASEGVGNESGKSSSSWEDHSPITGNPLGDAAAKREGIAKRTGEGVLDLNSHGRRDVISGFVHVIRVFITCGWRQDLVIATGGLHS